MSQKKIEAYTLTLLKGLFGLISTFLTIAGLPTLTQNLIAWEGFFLDLVRLYQDIMYPIYGWLLSWFPFTFPLWINDYLTIGFLIGTSYVQAILITERDNKTFSSIKNKLLLWVPIVLIMGFIWPIFLAPLLLALIPNSQMKHFRSKSLQTWLCLAIILFLLIITASINLVVYHS